MVDNNLNMKLTDGEGYFLNGSFGLDMIYGNNKKHFKNMTYHCLHIFDEILCPLHPDKLTF